MTRDKKTQPASPVRSGTVSGFRDAYKKAVTELLILRLLRDRDMYASEMQQEMARRSGGALSFNTLYLAIYRLKDLGYIEERSRTLVDGRERNYFGITAQGQGRFAELTEEYRRLAAAVEAMLPEKTEEEKE